MVLWSHGSESGGTFKIPSAIHGERRHVEEVRALRVVMDGRHLAGTSPGMSANPTGVYAKAPPALLTGGRKD